MDTRIRFLSDLEDDLMIAARRETATAPARFRRPHSRRVGVALGAVAFLVVAGVVGNSVIKWGPQPRRFSGQVGRVNNQYSPGAPGGPAPQGTSAPRPAASPAPASGAAGTGAPASDPGTLLVGPHVVKEANLRIVAARGGFATAFGAASRVASTHGGFVESSSSSGNPSVSGQLVIRVPAASFDDAIADLRGLGRIEGEGLTGQDVSAQYVDLQSRIRAWEAQETVLLRLMAEADSVQETLTVQRELQEVQLRIEQLKGQLRVLEDRTEMAVISVSMREAGAPPVARPTEKISTRPDLGSAWEKAVDGFLAVVFAVLVGLGYLVPIALLLGLLWVAYRRLRRRGAVPA